MPLTKFAPLQAFAKIIRDVGVEVKTLNLQGNGLFHLNDVTKTLGGRWLPLVGVKIVCHGWGGGVDNMSFDESSLTWRSERIIHEKIPRLPSLLQAARRSTSRTCIWATIS